MKDVSRTPNLLARAGLLALVHALLFALAGMLEGALDAVAVFSALGAAVGPIAFVTGAIESHEAAREHPVESALLVALLAAVGWTIAWLQAFYVLGLVRGLALSEGIAAVRQCLAHVEARYVAWSVLPFTWPFVADTALRYAGVSLGRRTLGAAASAAVLTMATLALLDSGLDPFDRHLASLSLVGSAVVASSLPVSLVLAERLMAARAARAEEGPLT